MTVFIVYKGEFCTDKPRCEMAAPEVLLTTIDREKAIAKVDEVKTCMRELGQDVQEYWEDAFEFGDPYGAYGMVGIIETKVE